MDYYDTDEKHWITTNYPMHRSYSEERNLELERFDIFQAFLDFQNHYSNSNYRTANKLLTVIITYCKNAIMRVRDIIDTHIIEFLLTKVIDPVVLPIVIKKHPEISQIRNNSFTLLLELCQTKGIIEFLCEMHIFQKYGSKLKITTDNYTILSISALFCKIIQTNLNCALSAVNDGVINNTISSIEYFCSTGYIGFFCKYVNSNIYILKYLFSYHDLISKQQVQSIITTMLKLLITTSSDEVSPIDKRNEILKSIVGLVAKIINYDHCYLEILTSTGIMFYLASLLSKIVYERIWTDIYDIFAQSLNLALSNQQILPNLLNLLKFEDLVGQFLQNPLKDYSPSILKLIHCILFAENSYFTKFNFERFGEVIAENYDSFSLLMKRVVISLVSYLISNNFSFFEQLFGNEVIFEFPSTLSTLDTHEQEEFAKNLYIALNNANSQRKIEKYFITKFANEYESFIDSLEDISSEESSVVLENLKKILEIE